MKNSTINLNERDENLAKWEISVLSVILIFTIIGNCLILFALHIRKYNHHCKSTRMYFFMTCLSIADLITAIFNVLPQLAWDITFRFKGGALLCKLIKFLQPFGIYLSSYVLIATAIDRYHAICYPLSYSYATFGRAKLMIYGACSLSFVLCIPQVILFSYREIGEDVWDCWACFDIPYGERAYVTWFSVTVFLLPFIVLSYTYIRICFATWHNSEIIQFNRDDRTGEINSNNKQCPLISRARITTIKQTLTVISLYIVTNTPFIGCQLWATWDPNATNSSFFTGNTFAIFALLSSLSSCINPWIYLGFDRELRVILYLYTKKMILREQHGDNIRDNMNFNNSTNRSVSSSVSGVTIRFVEYFHRTRMSHELLSNYTIPIPI